MGSNFDSKIGTFKAGADLSAKQYTFVKFGAAEDTVINCGADELPCGILMNAPGNGELAEVALPGGGAKIKSVGGAITRGGLIKSGAAGVGLARAAVVAESFYGAIAMETAADGDIISCMVMPGIQPKA